jgi:NADH-ubiquinone oxidoreductase chain 5
LFSASVALLQTDIKKIIAYSTCSQLGLMLVACGFHQYYLSLFHMINHGFFKALLFLSAGGIIHDSYNQQDTDEHIGSWILSPFTNTVSLIASLSLTGIYFGSGYYSKELIIALGNTFYTINVQLIAILLGLSTCLTTIYS